MTIGEIAPRVHRLGSRWVNWYLVEADDGITVVDTGFGGYYPQLGEALLAAGRDAGEVSAVVLTHHHGDHVGCAERIRRETGAAVHCPAGEAAMIRGEQKRSQPDGFLANAWRPALIRFLAHGARNEGMKMPSVAEVSGFGDGDVLEVPGRPQAIATPGHSPDHHSLLFAEHGVLFTGDALCSVDWVSGSTEPQLHPFGEDREVMPAALDALEPLEASLLAFGHGEPFRGTPAEAVTRARELAG